LVHFVSCPCFNKDECIVRLLKSLKKYALGGKEFGEAEQCIVYEKVFTYKPVPQKVLSKNQRSLLNIKMNTLVRLAEQFLATQTIKENESYKCELLYDTLLKRKQFWLLNRHLKKHKKELSQQKEKDVKYYAHQSKIEQVTFDYLHHSGQLIQKDNLPDLIHSVDMNYLLSKLELQLTALSMRHIPGKKEYDLSSMVAMIELLDLPQYAEQPLIILYRANVALMEIRSDETYFNLLSLLEHYESLVPISILKEIRLGKPDYIKNMFDLYKVMDTKNLLIDNGFISKSNLKNIVTAACRVEEFAWAEDAIERYRRYVRLSIRDNVCNYNLGVVAFRRKDYETAHDKFIQVDRIDKIYNYNTRVMILKCLYEKEKDYNDYTMQAFRSAHKYFKGDKSLPAKTRTGYTNFIQILINLYRLRHNVNATKADAERIKEKLEQQKVNNRFVIGIYSQSFTQFFNRELTVSCHHICFFSLKISTDSTFALLLCQLNPDVISLWNIAIMQVVQFYIFKGFGGGVYL